MERLVNYNRWRSDSALLNFGKMTMKDVQTELTKLGKEARSLLKETGADHVLYGMLLLNEKCEAVQASFYMNPMRDDEFEKKVASQKGFIFYAVHSFELREKKVFTFRFMYQGIDEFRSIDFCAESMNEARELFENWCEEHRRDPEQTFLAVEVVYEKSDAEEYGERYGSPEEYRQGSGKES